MFVSPNTMYYACSLCENCRLNRPRRVLVVGEMKKKKKYIYIYMRSLSFRGSYSTAEQLTYAI